MKREIRKAIETLQSIPKTYTCARCGHELPEEHFDYNGNTGGYYGNRWCLACTYTYNSLYNKYGKKECQRIHRALKRAKKRITDNRRNR